MPVPTTAALTIPAGSESLAVDLASTSVVSTSTAPSMAVDETTSVELLRDERIRKVMHLLERKNAGIAAEKRSAELETSRVKLEQDEKREAAANRTLSPGAAKRHAIERCTLMFHLSSS